jgi:hypothetical protein
MGEENGKNLNIFFIVAGTTIWMATYESVAP